MTAHAAGAALIRIEKGTPSPEELAALLTVLLARPRQPPAPPPARDAAWRAPAQRSGSWDAPAAWSPSPRSWIRRR